MSSPELQAEIDKKGEEEISRINENAKNEVGKIIAEANARSEALRAERTVALMRELDAEEKAQLAVLRMDEKGELLRSKNEWAGRVFKEAEKRIASMAERGGSDYRELLSKLILEGVAELKGNKFVVKTNPRDLEMIKNDLTAILERAAKIKNGRVEFELQRLSRTVLGGVIVSTADDTQYYNNILEARISSVTENLAGEVHKILFRAGEHNE